MNTEEDYKIYNGAYIYSNVSIGDNVTIFPGAVIGRPPLSSGATQRQKDSRKLLPVIIGDNCVIGSNAVIYNDVELGENTMVCDTACIREGVRIGHHSLIAMGVTVNYDTTIGNNVRIMDNTHITGNMIIEDNVFIGMLVTTANDNKMGRLSDEERNKKEWITRGPTIKKFTTIGQGACILPGIVIGENCIVGTNSVVTKDLKKEGLYVGIPAKRLRDLKLEEQMK